MARNPAERVRTKDLFRDHDDHTDKISETNPHRDLHATSTPLSQTPKEDSKERKWDKWKEVAKTIYTFLELDSEKLADWFEERREKYTFDAGEPTSVKEKVQKKLGLNTEKSINWFYETYKGRKTLNEILGLGTHDNRSSTELQHTTRALLDFTGQDGEEFDANFLLMETANWRNLLGNEAVENILNLRPESNRALPEPRFLARTIGNAVRMYYFSHPQHRQDLAKILNNGERLPFPGETFDFNHKDAREMSLHETIVVFIERELNPNREDEFTNGAAANRIGRTLKRKGKLTVGAERKRRLQEIHEAIKAPERESRTLLQTIVADLDE